MSKTLEALVNAALDNAYQGGYEDVLTAEPGDEAINLLDYDADIAEHRDAEPDSTTVMDLVPLIEAWQRKNKLARRP